MIEPARLADIEEIRRLKARYFRTLDTQDWPGFRTVFTDDATIGPIDGGYPLELLPNRPGGREPMTTTSIGLFIERVAENSVGRITTHHGHQHEIEFTGDDEATGIWAMEDVLVWLHEGNRFRGSGHYWETYRRVDGEWLISSMKLTRLYAYVESFPPARDRHP